MKKLTVNQIKELQKKGDFTIQKIFNLKNANLQDFLEDNNICDMVFELLPDILDGFQKKYISIGIYSDGHIELS